MEKEQNPKIDEKINNKTEPSKDSEKIENNNQNKTPSKMARLAWPKAKYGAIIAVIIIIVVNILFYWETITSFFK